MADEFSAKALQEVMTAAEAAELWGKAPITVQQACSGYKKGSPRFLPTETRKAGRIWLITRTGMERVFGKRKNMENISLYQFAHKLQKEDNWEELKNAPVDTAIELIKNEVYNVCDKFITNEQALKIYTCLLRYEMACKGMLEDWDANNTEDNWYHLVQEPLETLENH